MWRCPLANLKGVNMNRYNSFKIKKIGMSLGFALAVLAPQCANASTEPYNFNFSIQGNHASYPVEVFSNKKFIYLEFSSGIKPFKVYSTVDGIYQEDSFHVQHPYYVIPYYGRKTKIITNKGDLIVIDNSYVEKNYKINESNIENVNNTTPPKTTDIISSKMITSPVIKTTVLPVSKLPIDRESSLNINNNEIPNINSATCDRSLINVGEKIPYNHESLYLDHSTNLSSALKNIIPNKLSIALSNNISPNMSTTYRSGPWEDSLKALSRNNYLCSIVDWNNKTVYVMTKDSQVKNYVNGDLLSDTYSQSKIESEAIKEKNIHKEYIYMAKAGETLSHSLRKYLKDAHTGYSLSFNSPLNLYFHYNLTVQSKTLLGLLNKLGKNTGYKFSIYNNNVITAVLATGNKQSILAKEGIK